LIAVYSGAGTLAAAGQAGSLDRQPDERNFNAGL